MRRVLIALACLCLALRPTAAHAQATASSSISGTVLDAAGGVVPGATVTVASASGARFETVTNSSGVFSVPALNPGTYTVTVALAGFKTAVVDRVRVVPDAPASVKVTLEIGTQSETITVQSSAELINTQTATVSSTLNSDQILRAPTPTRNALNAVTFLPGVNVATTNRNANINGLPDSFVNITLDGVSNNDNFLRSSDAFFASVTPRQDAVEAVAVTSAVGGANVGGSGAVLINFTTRSGTNTFAGSGYEYYRSPKFNTNYWFNKRNHLPKNDVKVNQYGFRAGGPIVLPGFDGHNKAFFFVNYEQVRFPNSFTRTRTVLNPRAMDGWFRYQVGNDVREVNVLALAAANGQIGTLDPTIRSLLDKITSSMQTTGANSATSDPLLNSYVWLSPGRLFEHQPTVRIDYNLTAKHRLAGSFQEIWAERDPDYLNNADARFPGAPNYRVFRSSRPLTSITLRSTLTSNIVNELRGGITAKGGASYFGKPDDVSNGIGSFEDQGGLSLNFDQNIGLTDWTTTNGPSWRSVPTYSIEDSVSWQRGRHALNFGGSYLLSTGWESAQQIVPSVQLGFDTNRDPAAGLFTTANFPNASSGQLTDARELYALLTGRVVSISSQAALDPGSNQYVDLGPRTRAGRIAMYSVYGQDSWRVTPTTTLNVGLRWDVQLPFEATNSIMSSITMADACGVSGLGAGGLYTRCNFFQPGASGGVTPAFRQLTKGTLGYDTDWNNVAPSVSVAWRPDVQAGFLRRLLGDPEQATLRGGYSEAYDRQGLSVWTGQFGSNAGSTISTTRSATSGDPLVPAGQSWPVLLSQRDRLSTASFPATPAFPIPILVNRGSSLFGFAPDIKIASARTWTVGFQRSLSKDMAMEIRYVGTRGVNQWSSLNYNLIRGESLLKNGFLDEFRLAMANLQANNAVGGSRAGSFAYFGPGTGTSPLPIYLAYLVGRTDASNAAAYTGGSQTWSNSTFASRLSVAYPQPVTSAQDLDGNSIRRANALAAGLPANFFVPNPDVNQVNIYDSGAYSTYHSLQFDVRRRLSGGLSADVNYQYALEGGSAFDGFSFGRVLEPTANVRHAIKTQWDYAIPVGRGQHFGAGLPSVLNAILGDWSITGVGRIQARVIDFGNVRLVGMTKKDLQQMYKHYIRTEPNSGLPTVFMLPQDVIDNTRAAWTVGTTTVNGYSLSLGAPNGRYIAPPNTADCLQIRAGDCAPRSLIIRAPWFTRFDIGATKKFPIHGSMNVEVRFDLLNAFDNINFDPYTPGSSLSGATIFQVTSAYQDPSNTYDPGGRLGQLMLRINW